MFYVSSLLEKKLSSGTFVSEDYTVFEHVSTDVAIVLERIRPFEKIKTDYKKSLEVAEKMSQQATFATLTRGIAHEIRNPMGMMLSSVELMVDYLNDKKKLSEYLEIIKKSIIRLTKVTSSMLKYGASISQEKTKTSINEILEDIILVASGELIKKKVKIVKKYGSIPDIIADPNTLSQAFLNVLLNAIESLDGFGGTITIQTKIAEFLNQNGKTMNGIEVTFTDTGKGISDENIKKIFDPFFTTKYENTGLGMAIILKTINEHQGMVSVDSKEGKGTSISIYIPQ